MSFWLIRLLSTHQNQLAYGDFSLPGTNRSPPCAGFFVVRQAWRVARKRNLLGCGGRAGDLEVKVLYTPGKGKC